MLGPSHPPSPDSDSPPNDASVVLLVQSHGVRLLLMGDEESSAQEQLWRDTGGGLRADVLSDGEIRVGDEITAAARGDKGVPE